MEVKIGIAESSRELVLRSSQTQEEVEKLVNDALAKGADILTLKDDKGRKFLVPSVKIAYVEIGAADVRRVGFAG